MLYSSVSEIAVLVLKILYCLVLLGVFCSVHCVVHAFVLLLPAQKYRTSQIVAMVLLLSQVDTIEWIPEHGAGTSKVRVDSYVVLVLILSKTCFNMAENIN